LPIFKTVHSVGRLNLNRAALFACRGGPFPFWALPALWAFANLRTSFGREQGRAYSNFSVWWLIHTFYHLPARHTSLEKAINGWKYSANDSVEWVMLNKNLPFHQVWARPHCLLQSRVQRTREEGWQKNSKLVAPLVLCQCLKTKGKQEGNLNPP